MTDWKLNEHDEAIADSTINMLLAARMTGRRIVSYKGLLGDREIIVIAVLIGEGEGTASTRPVAIAMTGDIFRDIAVERRDGSVRRGV